MFLQPAPVAEDTAKLFQVDLDEMGFVMNLSRLWAWRPDVGLAFTELRGMLTGASSLSRRELGVIVCTTAATLGDSYCALAWGRLLADTADPATAAAVLRLEDSDGFSARDRALAGWVRKVVVDPTTTTAADVEPLRATGFSEREIFEATAFTAFRIAFGTVNAALGGRPDWQVATAAPAEVRAAVTYGRPVAERIAPG